MKKQRSLSKFFESYAIWFVLIVSVIASIIATTYYYRHNDILAYADARSHLDIARRVFDSKTPGIQQLGTVWLPLPHILMLPFIADYTLWHTGLAGSIVSMISYIVSALFIYKIVNLLTRNAFASFIAACIFMSNSNILYMQSTPMTELPLIATMLFGSYFFIKWLYTKQTSHLILAAFGIMLSTLARYEGWFVLAMCTLIILFDGIVLSKKRKIAEGQAVLFATLGTLGIFLWVLWNWVIFGSPLYFLDGPYSAQAQQNQLAAEGGLPTKHNLLLSLTTTFQSIDLNAGKISMLIAILALVVVLYKRLKDKRLIYALIVLFAPVVLDFITLFLGITAVTIEPSQTFNIRYGVMGVPIIAVLIALAVGALKMPRFFKVILGVCAVVASILAVTITLRYDTVLSRNSANSPTVLGLESALRKNYKSGNILASSYSFDPIMQQVGLPLKDYVDDGTYRVWDRALVRPQDYASYVLINNGSGSSDPLYKDYLQRMKVFNNHYDITYDKGGLELLTLKEHGHN